MLLKLHYELAKTSIKQNRSRNLLTCLGMAIGIASIVLILSLTTSISTYLSAHLGTDTTNLLVVRPATASASANSLITSLTSSSTYLTSPLTLSDAEAIAGRDSVSAVAPLAATTATISTEEKSVPSATILATTPAFTSIEPLTLKSGIFFTTNSSSTTAVIGETLATELFANSEPVGKTITLAGTRYIIIGVVTDQNAYTTLTNLDYNNTLFIQADSLATSETPLQISQILIQAINTDSLSDLQSTITSTLTAKKSGEQNFTVLAGSEITNPLTTLLLAIGSMLTLVAAISLFVGGIGIMNIMLVSVAERTHEIGIRKAVGATASNILSQFLLESLLLSALGAFLGLILGYLATFAISLFTPFAPAFDPLFLALIFVITTLIGTIFGLYPALKAARKDPISSLKDLR